MGQCAECLAVRSLSATKQRGRGGMHVQRMQHNCIEFKSSAAVELAILFSQFTNSLSAHTIANQQTY